MATFMLVLGIVGLILALAGVVTLFVNMYKVVDSMKMDSRQTFEQMERMEFSLLDRMKVHIISMALMGLGGFCVIVSGIYHLVIWLR